MYYKNAAAMYKYIEYVRGIWTLGEFGHSLRLKLLTYFHCQIHNLWKLFPVTLNLLLVLSIVIELNLNASDEKVSTNATTLVNSIVKTCLL